MMSRSLRVVLRERGSSLPHWLQNCKRYICERGNRDVFHTKFDSFCSHGDSSRHWCLPYECSFSLDSHWNCCTCRSGHPFGRGNKFNWASGVVGGQILHVSGFSTCRKRLCEDYARR